ncbi:MAG: hypothetical protein KA436_07625 [Oligoflexales bacterium]|nr:hypothetical protein [Oligoflexales bacterium]
MRYDGLGPVTALVKTPSPRANLSKYSQLASSLRAKRSNLRVKARLLRRLRLLAMTKSQYLDRLEPIRLRSGQAP